MTLDKGVYIVKGGSVVYQTERGVTHTNYFKGKDGETIEVPVDWVISYERTSDYFKLSWVDDADGTFTAFSILLDFEYRGPVI